MPAECPVCLSKKTTEMDLDLRMCNRCTHYYQYPAEVTAVYNRQYVKERYDSYDTTDMMSCLRLGIVMAFTHGNGRLLDVGYGNGSFAKLAEKAGFRTYGFDVHKADYGVREAELCDHRWDVVTFFDSLEHMPNFDEVRRMKTGFVVISWPSMPPHFPEGANEWKHFRPGEHLHYFTTLSMSQLFKNHRAVWLGWPEDVIRGRCIFGPYKEEHPNIRTIVLKHKDMD